MSVMSDPMDESFVDDYLDPQSSPAPLEKTRPVRQGLPSGYRMRHDAHYVDELESRRRPSDTTPPALAFPTSIPVTFALRDMSQELEGVASCFNLVSTKDRIVPAAAAPDVGSRVDIDAGHVGMIVGSRARALLWERLRDWLKA